MEKIWNDVNKTNLGGIAKNLQSPDRRLVLCAKHTVSYMTIRDTKVSGTLLADTEICDFLCERYNVTPLTF